MYSEDYNVEEVIDALNDAYGFKSAEEHEAWVKEHLDHVEDYFRTRKFGGLELNRENILKHKDYLLQYITNPNKEGGIAGTFTMLKENKSKVVVLGLMLIVVYLIVK